MALAQILLRGGTSAEWAAANPVLAAREIAYDTTLKRAKVGDGQNSWSALPWVTMSAAEVARLEAAATALEGATAPTDAAMTTIQANPNSAFAQAQKATIAASAQPRSIDQIPTDSGVFGEASYVGSGLRVIGTGAGGTIYMCTTVGATIRRSTDNGATTVSLTVPSGVTDTGSLIQMYEWKGYVYAIMRDSADSRFKLYRAPITTGSTALTWSAALMTLTAGFDNFGYLITGTSQALVVGEYGDPLVSGSPAASIWRSTNGTTWATVKTYASNYRHVHCVAADPYNDGHIWAAVGDNVNSCFTVSTDHGATWTNVAINSTWQSCQISFSPDWIYAAPDAVTAASLIVIDRATRTPRVGAWGSHRALAVRRPGDYSNGKTTSGSTTFTIEEPDYGRVFSASDIGRKITCSSLPNGTTITGYNSPTSVTVSAAATVTANRLTFSVDRQERTYLNCYHGAVDPATGIYYGVANADPSTGVPLVRGRAIFFAVPYIGAPVVHLADILNTGNMGVHIVNGQVFNGQQFIPLIKAPPRV